MDWIPDPGNFFPEDNTGDVGVGAQGTTVTTSGDANVKGTPAQLIAATAWDSYWITILAEGYGVAGSFSEGSLDILIGAATESILIPDLLIGSCGWNNSTVGLGGKRWDFPLYIPAGSRLAAQAQGIRLSTGFKVSVFLHGGPIEPPWKCGTVVTTYGVGAQPYGTVITAGAAGAEGAWTQITAATTRNHFCLVPSFQLYADSTINLRTLQVDLGIGAATEQKIGPGYWYHTDTQEFMNGPCNSFPTFFDVPLGTRLVMRASDSGTNDNYNGCIHGVS